MARTDPKPSPVEIADQQAEILDLKRKGLSIRRIAAQLGMPPSTVQDRYEAAIAELVMPAADEVRLLELERLDSWHVKLEERLAETLEPEKVVPALLRCQERRSRYLGLDAPERAEVTTTMLPSADAEVEALLSEAREAQ